MEISETLYSKYIKRFLDVMLSALFLVGFGWLYMALALVVLVKMGKPVIFPHRRPGMIDKKTGEEKIFTMYKYRSMTNETDENGVLLPNTVRLTEFGKKLRRTSLDELPEVWNIFKGDMSIVGPRPLQEKYLDYYTEKEHYRHIVRPGLTGLAQINGRTSINWDEKLAYDIQYVSHITFWGDLKILIQTVKSVLVHKNIVEAGKQGDFSDYRKKQWDDGTVQKSSEGYRERIVK